MTLKLNGTTSGSVSLDAPATGSNVSFTLPGSTGTSGQLLSTNGAGVLSFVNGGKILQVVRATDATQRSTTSTTFVDVTGMSVTITPQQSSSAVLLIASFSAFVRATSGTDVCGFYIISDSSNNAISGTQTAQFRLTNNTYSGTFDMLTFGTLFGYATPNTTSATTYKMRFRVAAANTTVYLDNGSTTGQLFAIEVAA